MSQPSLVEKEIRAVIDAWVHATIQRDANAFADLFSLDPEPVVVWSSGETSTTWKSVHAHAKHDFERGDLVIPKVDTYDLRTVDLAEGLVEVAFHYDMYVKDLWGHERRHVRVATMTARRTKDGWRITGAHFSAVPV
ncbi:MAG: YybH family protein [Thermoplasmatota archaeon]